MTKLLNSGLVLGIFLCINGQNTPCGTKNYSTITHKGHRYVNYRIDETFPIYQDSFLREGWYYVGEDTMPETTPDALFVCGTKFPIWLNGSHPDDEMPVERSACQMSLFDDCDYEYDIRIAKCEGFYLYYLPRTASSNSAYCFGVPSSYTPPKPIISASLEKAFVTTRTGRQAPVSKTVFKCEFEESATETLVYVVNWYRNGHIHHRTPAVANGKDKKAHLTEHTFQVEGFKMGDEISCTVGGFTAENGPPSKISPQSDPLFVGIKILTPFLTFDANETNADKRTIRLQSTIPIGCEGAETCKIKLTTYIPTSSDTQTCQGLAFVGRVCGTYLKSDPFDSIVELVVETVDNGRYRAKQEFYEIVLKTEATSENKIWRNYELPPIKVNVKSINTLQEGKVCFSINDPHIQTFD